MKLFKSKLLSKKKLDKNTFWFSFSKPAGFVFKPGQFISLKVPSLTIKSWRSYSLITTPSEKTIEIVVRLVPNGSGSEYLKSLKVNDEVVMRGPLGKFLFKPSKNVDEFWFVCTGTGVAPFIPMIKTFLPKLKNKKFVLLFGNRDQKCLHFCKEFKKMEKEYDNFVYMPSLTNESWKGLKGRVYKHLPKDVKRKHFYICGMRNMIEDTKKKLITLGANVDQIFFESYT